MFLEDPKGSSWELLRLACLNECLFFLAFSPSLKDLMPSIHLQQWKRKSSMCSRTVKLPSRQATDSRVPHGTPLTEFLPPALPLPTRTTGGIPQLFSSFLHSIQISYNHIQV